MDINIINLENFDINKLRYAKSCKNGSNKKISIGYDNNTDLYILTPYITNTNSYQRNSYIKLLFDPLLGDILKFYNIIESLEDDAKRHINKYSNTLKINSIIKRDNSDLFDDSDNENDSYIKMLYINLLNQKYKVYNHNSEECNLNELKNGWKFKMLLKIDSIWINTSKKRFGLKIDLIQLKIHQPIYQTKCLIDIPVSQEYKRDIIARTNETQININQMINVPMNIPDRTLFKPPNITELLKMKNGLKKVLE